MGFLLAFEFMSINYYIQSHTISRLKGQMIAQSNTMTHHLTAHVSHQKLIALCKTIIIIGKVKVVNTTVTFSP